MQKSVSFVFSALLLLAVTAKAEAAIDAAGAEELKKIVVESLSFHQDMAKTTGNGLALGGEVSVTPKESFYEITLPDVTYVFGEGSKFNIGTVLANAVPGEPGEYLVSMKLPSPITIYDATNTAAAEIAIGKQKFSAAWRPALDIATKVDAEYADLSLRSLTKTEDTDVKATIGSIRSVLALAENADKTWSGPNSFQLSDLKVTLAGRDNGTFSIAGIEAVSRYEKMDLASAGEMKKKVSALMKGGQQPSPEEQKAFVDGMMGTMGAFADGVTSSFELTGLQGDITPGKDPERPTKSTDPARFSLAKLSTAFDMQGMTQESGKVHLKMGLDGLSVQNQAEDIAGLIPGSGNIEIMFDNLPMKALGDSFSGLIKQAMDSAVAAENAAGTVYQAKANAEMQQNAMMSLMAVPQLLVNAGSTLTVANTFFNAPDISSALDGRFTASATSPMMATGAITLTLKGLDETIAKLQALAQKPEANPRTAGIAQALAIMQMQGQLGQGADGKTSRTYKLEITPDGKAQMNGVDVGMLLGGLGGGMGGGEEAMPAPPQETMPTP